MDLKTILKKIYRVFLHIFWMFPIKQNRIVFQSFNGTEYSDSCKAMIEYIHDRTPGKYELYWVTKDDSHLVLPAYNGLHKVKKHTLRFAYYCLTAGTIICNIIPEEYLPLRAEQKTVDIWHGMPYKVLGKDDGKDVQSFAGCTVFLSPCKFYTERVIRESFQFDGEVLECGLPRNDILFRGDTECVKKNVYGVCQLNREVQTVLFAPTFRGDFMEIDTHLDFAGTLAALRKRFGGEWVLLYRSHPMLEMKEENLPSCVINMTSYPDMAELLVTCDVLITDYSSSMWDFALTRKPVFLYTPDMEDYIENRGFYVNMETLPFSLGRDNVELEKNVLTFVKKSYETALEKYFVEMGSFEEGRACEALANKIDQWCL